MSYVYRIVPTNYVMTKPRHVQRTTYYSPYMGPQMTGSVPILYPNTGPWIADAYNVSAGEVFYETVESPLTAIDEFNNNNEYIDYSMAPHDDFYEQDNLATMQASPDDFYEDCESKPPNEPVPCYRQHCKKDYARVGTPGIDLKVDTFIFADFEATNLIQKGKNGSRLPYITELSLVAARREDIKPSGKNKLAVPRILHKLSIPVRPREPINPEAATLTGLTDDSLSRQHFFDDDSLMMIMHFINRLPGVACFVAHNGKGFDFPVFMEELTRLEKTLPDRLLCVDSLTAFRVLFGVPEPRCAPVKTLPRGYGIALATIKRPHNFKLTTLHEHLTGHPVQNLHTAEDDCISLLRCAMQMGKLFVDFADNHAIPINLYRQPGEQVLLP